MPSSSLEARSGSWPAIMTIAGAGILAACQVGKVPAAGHMLQHDMELTVQMLSWLVSAFAVAASGVGNIAGGQLRNWGLRPGLLLALGFVAMALSAAGIFHAAGSATAALVLCMLFAFASGLVPVVILASASHHAPRPELLGATMGLIMQGNNIGLLVGPSAAGVAVAAFGWPAISVLIGGFVLAALCLITAFGRLSRASLSRYGMRPR